MTGNPGHKNRRLVSASTVRRERGLLQSIFERAIDEGYEIRNPFRREIVWETRESREAWEKRLNGENKVEACVAILLDV